MFGVLYTVVCLTLLITQTTAQCTEEDVANLENLIKEVAEQKQEVAELKQEITEQKQEISNLKQKQNTTVMFSAWLNNHVTLSPGEVVIFNREITDVGNNYNTSTGVFTCPVAGYYVFDVNVVGLGHKQALVELRRNYENLVRAVVKDKMDIQSASSHMEIVLHPGDRVYVNAVWYLSSSLYGSEGKYTTFSGHLVNTL